MKFVVESISKSAGRVGILSNVDRLPDKIFKTPFLLFFHPNLSREVLQLGFDLSNDFGISLPISNIEQMEKPLKIFQKGLSEFVGLKECLTFVTIKNASELTPTGHHVKNFLPIWRKAGKMNLSPEKYMSIIEAANPDFFVSLADGDTWKECPKKRVIKACERSEEMFEECMAKIKLFDESKTCKMIATVEGGFNKHERQKCVEHLKQFEDSIFGYFLDGFHRNGHEAALIDEALLKDIVKYTTSILPQDKMRIMSGCYLPHVTLELISSGVDIFDSSFINIVTKMNRALVFNFDLDDASTKRFPEINLMDSKYKEDFTPFLENCECLACKKHTRAYTNHLLVTRELLGPMLLTIHNLHHYKRFFESIRRNIKDDKLPELLSLVTDQYKEALLSYEPLEEKKDRKNSE